MLSRTGLSPSTAGHSKPLPLTHNTRAGHGSSPQPHTRHPCQVSHAYGLSIIHVRSPLLAESLLFSSPAGTEMFHFPALPPHHLYIQWQATTHNRGQVSPFGHPRINALLATP